MGTGRVAALLMSTTCVVMVLAGCVSRATTDTRPATEKIPPAAERVEAPDLLGAIKDYQPEEGYFDDPEGFTEGLTAHLQGVADESGLQCEVEYQPITLDDRQEPAPGTAVEKGTTVKVWIGIGD